MAPIRNPNYLKGEYFEIVDPRDDELLRLINVVNDLRERQHHVFINVNNHYEGSALQTIEKINALLQKV